jgi:hypothetical protein
VRQRQQGSGRVASLRQLGKDVLLASAVATFLFTGLSKAQRFSGEMVLAATCLAIVVCLLHICLTPAIAGRASEARWALAVGALGAGLLLLPPLAVAGPGLAITLAIAARGRKLSFLGREAGFACTVALAFCSAALYGIAPMAEAVAFLARVGDRPRVHTLEELEYADLCKELPDPRRIGHELGPLFEHDGAVEAGCGGPAENVGKTESVWISVGICEGRLRSLAVAGEGHEPVLLYGTPAKFALHAAEEEELRYAESAEPGSGDVDIVTTEDGSYVFARSTQSASSRSAEALRCGEIDEVAQPFTRLPPPIAELWFQEMPETGWTWPLPGREESAEFSFLDEDPVGLVASAGCREETICYFDVDRGGRRWFSGPAVVSMVDLSEYMPAHVE